MATHTFTLLCFRCSHPVSFKRDTCKENLKYFSHRLTYKTFCWGSPGYQMCLQNVQALAALEHAQKIAFVSFIQDKCTFSRALTEASRARSRLCRYWFWILGQNLSLFPNSMFFRNTGHHFNSCKTGCGRCLALTAAILLMLCSTGCPLSYISRRRKCNSVSECIRRKEPFKVQGKCHDF